MKLKIKRSSDSERMFWRNWWYFSFNSYAASIYTRFYRWRTRRSGLDNEKKKAHRFVMYRCINAPKRPSPYVYSAVWWITIHKKSGWAIRHDIRTRMNEIKINRLDSTTQKIKIDTHTTPEKEMRESGICTSIVIHCSGQIFEWIESRCDRPCTRNSL